MPRKPWAKMTTAELAHATREYDHGPGPKPRRPPEAELAKLKAFYAAKPMRRPGRPRLGAGAVRVLFTIDPELLMRIDAFAKANNMKRSHLISAGAEEYMRNHSVSTGLKMPRPAKVPKAKGLRRPAA